MMYLHKLYLFLVLATLAFGCHTAHQPEDSPSQNQQPSSPSFLADKKKKKQRAAEGSTTDTIQSTDRYAHLKSISDPGTDPEPLGEGAFFRAYRVTVDGQVWVYKIPKVGTRYYGDTVVPMPDATRMAVAELTAKLASTLEGRIMHELDTEYGQTYYGDAKIPQQEFVAGVGIRMPYIEGVDNYMLQAAVPFETWEQTMRQKRDLMGLTARITNLPLDSTTKTTFNGIEFNIGLDSNEANFIYKVRVDEDGRYHVQIYWIDPIVVAPVPTEGETPDGSAPNLGK